MNKLHGGKEKREHCLRQGGPKTSPNSGHTTTLSLRPNRSLREQLRMSTAVICNVKTFFQENETVNCENVIVFV